MTTISRKISLLLVVAGLAGGVSSVNAQSSANTTGTINARVLMPISIEQQTPMNFGSVIGPVAGTGTATLAPNAPVNVPPMTTGGAGAVTQGSNTSGHYYGPGPATFHVEGEALFGVAVTLPSTVVMINRAGGPLGTSLNVHTFTCTLPGNAGTLSGPSPSWGMLDFGVGATVDIPSGSSTGWYNGTYNVSVAYN